MPEFGSPFAYVSAIPVLGCWGGAKQKGLRAHWSARLVNQWAPGSASNPVVKNKVKRDKGRLWMSSGLYMHISYVLCMHMCTYAHTLSTSKGIVLNHKRMPIFIILHSKDSILTGFYLTQLQGEAGFLEASSMLIAVTYNLHPCHGSL